MLPNQFIVNNLFYCTKFTKIKIVAPKKYKTETKDKTAIKKTNNSTEILNEHIEDK